ncbi:RNA polymerase ECF-type sigma factor [Oceanobacillus iheyensis HTE831]|uniref:RNA polymerase ECF-type sigma factor n=1 Tax=Oceanobacillus iheyensis (strain DSM 14371 / CIP 107618 / JCM 11309 / KCTC 3954 / HTE831) TaxID=221109 RepID=Q8ERN2_OCEIH|nr:sigma-70 family RNA polymerase sigma factor [Oceanobacillus iheyensis]BAC13225.1 RNA polymerase ECF-type sigma factor [Oceanobacillus iheyensis HTE831]
MDEEKKIQILEEVMLEYGNDLVRLAFNYVKDKETAKDMVQETFIKCYEKLDEFRNESNLKTWLYRITINQCKDYLRSWHYRKVQTKSVIENTFRTVFPLTEEKIINQANTEEMLEIVASLTKNYREIIYLYYYKSLTISEITDVTGLNENTVKTRLRRAKQRLKTMMKEADIYG